MTSQPHRRLSLRRNFSWILVGSLIENGAKWALFVVLAKLLDADVVGTFSLALAIATPITILAQLQLRVALITDARDEFPFGAYHALRWIASLLSGVVVAAVGVLFYGFGATALLIALVGVAQVVTSMRDIWLGLSQKHERMDVTARGNILDGLLSLFLFAATLLVTRSVHWAVVGMIAAHVATLLYYDRPRTRAALPAGHETAPVWDRAVLFKLFYVVLPLGLTTALVALNSNIPRYFIEHAVGRDEVGYFSAIFYFVFAANLVVAALGRAASPRLARQYHQSRRAFGRLLVRLLAIGAFIGALGVLCSWLFGAFFLRVVYTPEYADQAHILVILMIAGALRFVTAFIGVGISAARFFTAQTVTNGITSLVTLVSCWLMIPRWGLAGAAWSTVIVALVSLAMSSVILWHAYRRITPERADA